MTQPWPMTIREIAELMQRRGDGRDTQTIRAQLVRMCQNDEFGIAARKTGPGTAAWEVRREAVHEWLETLEVEGAD
jgi:hypothetical protein